MGLERASAALVPSCTGICFTWKEVNAEWSISEQKLELRQGMENKTHRVTPVPKI